jgi:hypothetical protein
MMPTRTLASKTHLFYTGEVSASLNSPPAPGKKAWLLVWPLLFFLVAPALSQELLHDPGIRDGLLPAAPKIDKFAKNPSYRQNQVLNNLKSRQKPSWKLFQWGNARNLGQVSPVIDGHQYSWHTWASPELQDKLLSRVTLFLPENSSSNTLTLELNGKEQFAWDHLKDEPGEQAQYIQSLKQNWPHLFISQDLDFFRLDDFSNLRFNMQARLVFDNRNIEEGYVHDIHAGRFVVIFSIHNTFSRNYFWLILPVYDDRFTQSPFGCRRCTETKCRSVKQLGELEDGEQWRCPFDGGPWRQEMEKYSSFKMMFRVGSRSFMDGSLHDNQWHNINFNLQPHAREAIKAVRTQVKSRGFSPSLHNYYISNIIIGWEINGLNHAAVEIREPSLSGKPIHLP